MLIDQPLSFCATLMAMAVVLSYGRSVTAKRGTKMFSELYMKFNNGDHASAAVAQKAGEIGWKLVFHAFVSIWGWR